MHRLKSLQIIDYDQLPLMDLYEHNSELYVLYIIDWNWDIGWEKWIAVPTNKKALNALMKSKISIRDFFFNASQKKAKIVIDNFDDEVKYMKLPHNIIMGDELPENDVYIEPSWIPATSK